MKSKQRIQSVIEGRLPMEDLTDRELRKLERLIFKAVAIKNGVSVIPASKTKH